MSLRRIRCFLTARDIKDRWEIQNIFAQDINQASVNYQILTTSEVLDTRHVTFYLHGLGGAVEDTAFLEDHICPYTPLIRVGCFGLNKLFRPAIVATFGDICTLLYNGRQCLVTIADILGVRRYNVIGHSWGGFIACLSALCDRRCEKALLLVSSPDICDAIANMYELFSIPSIGRPFADVVFGKLRWDAMGAKAGKGTHQVAWNQISPYEDVPNRRLKMLIFNRAEDRVMRKENVEHFIDYSRKRGFPDVTAEFKAFPDLNNWHDMPLGKFSERMRAFLFETDAIHNAAVSESNPG